MKHTPGQWNYEISPTNLETEVYAGNEIICEVEDGNEANAKLIAAAPELLEVLQNVLPYLKATGTNGNHFISEVEAAIKKATT